jgi:hypothetical protein
MLPVSLSRVDGTVIPVPFNALVDSGADGSMFKLDMMPVFGVTKADCDEREQKGAGGTSTFYCWKGGTVNASFLGVKMNLILQFSDTPMVLLGREDFFSYFKIEFDHAQKHFVLDEY